MRYAPVIIPTLNRYEHFKNCLESLEACVGAEYTDVHIGLDYPPEEKYIEGWRLIDNYLFEKERNNRFHALIVYRRKENYLLSGKGNAKTIVNRLKKKEESYILSEDDNIFSPNFLIFMNTCLEKYKNNPDIVCVTGYSYPIDWITKEGATVQIQNFNASSWGRAWWSHKKTYIDTVFAEEKMYYEADEDIKKLRYKRLINASLIEYVAYIIGSGQKLMKCSSDVGMRAYIGISDKYVVSPIVSLVCNKGFDGSGLYCQDNYSKTLDNTEALSYDYNNQPIDVRNYFDIVENDPAFLEENRRKLNDFDRRSIKQVFKAKMILILVHLFGLQVIRFLYSKYRDFLN